MSKVLIHENFTDSANDIGILQLGKKDTFDDPQDFTDFIFNSQTSGWIFQSSAQSVSLVLMKALLVRTDMSMVSKGILRLIHNAFPFSGWGDTGVQDTSTDKLHETVVPIVDPSSCGEDVDEDLIVCAGGLGVGTGPCKVSLQIILISHDNPG